MGQQLNDHEIDEPRRRRIVIVVLENDVFNVRELLIDGHEKDLA